MTSLVDAVKIALLMTGLVTATQVPHTAFAQRPLVLYLIDAGYDMAVLVTGSVIIFLLS